MRKILILLAIMAFSVMSFAQMRTSTLPSGNTYTSVSTDFTLTDAVAQYWQINAGQNWYTAQELVINLDSLSGDHTNIAIQLYGRLNSNDTWATIGSAINWLGATGGDTTIVYSNTTENKYRQFKLLYTPTGTGTTTIDDQAFKQYFGLP